MGLDMYAYSVPADMVGDEQVDIDFAKFTVPNPDGRALDHKPGVDANFAYWRKFNHLHGWMEDLYRKKGGARQSFNCDLVRLMPEDIDQLEVDATAGKLKAREGFFFGGSDMYPEDFESIFDFVNKAREAIAQGKAVIYSSWW